MQNQLIGSTGIDNNFFIFLKRKCNGMMSPDAYYKIFEIAKNSPFKNALEIGTSKGAATISYALRLQAALSNTKIWSIDKFLGGSWGESSSVLDNHLLARRNIDFFR